MERDNQTGEKVREVQEQVIKLFGYCSVTIDPIHFGHINFLEACSRKCLRLIVGLMTDRYIEKYKNRKPIMTYLERSLILSSICTVSKVIPQDTFDLPYKFLKGIYGDMITIFDSEEHAREGADVLIPKTPGISSTIIRQRIYESFNNSQQPI